MVATTTSPKFKNKFTVTRWHGVQEFCLIFVSPPEVREIFTLKGQGQMLSCINDKKQLPENLHNSRNKIKIYRHCLVQNLLWKASKSLYSIRLHITPAKTPIRNTGILNIGCAVASQ